MQDRQPGAPGQYKATLTAAEFQKMQAGEQFTITMVRDDQPIVEGTPYSKAAVLPDALAAIICPDVLNPTPADALGGLLPRNGKAAMTSNLPMGGHRVTELGEPAADGDAVPLGFANENFALKIAEKFTPAFSAVNAAPSDLLMISLSGNYDASSNLWCGNISTEDASQLTNSPISSGPFYAFRTVEKSPVGHFLVTIKEMYPIAGRIWCNMYDKSVGTWLGWKSTYTIAETAQSKADNALPKTGGDLTGWVKFNGTTIGLEWTTADGTIFQVRPYTSGNIFQIVTRTTDGKTVASLDVKNDGSVKVGLPDAFKQNIGITDHVVAQGTSGIWNYRKWSRGIAECWANYNSVPGVLESAGASSCFYYAVSDAIAFPFTFVKLQSVQANVNDWNYANLASSATVNKDNATICRVMLFQTHASIADGGYDISIHAIGTWK